MHGSRRTSNLKRTISQSILTGLGGRADSCHQLHRSVLELMRNEEAGHSAWFELIQPIGDFLDGARQECIKDLEFHRLREGRPRGLVREYSITVGVGD